MIHHVSLGSNDLSRSKQFYDAVMPVIGLRCLESDQDEVTYGTGVFLLSLVRPKNGQNATPGNGVHVAFGARTRAMVDEFHRTAISHGALDAGAPGLRPEYDAHYYGAFVLDPDGTKIEAVTYSAQP